MREAIKLLLLSGDDLAVAPLTATTTTASETVTLQSIGVSAATEIDWGDGNIDTLTGTATRTHTYAAAGTHDITFSNVVNLTTFDVRDSKIAVNTAALRGSVKIVNFTLLTVSGTIDTSDMINWRPTTWQCIDMPSTATINIDTSDMINWRPTTWSCYNMPSTATINIDTSDMVNWRPTIWRYFNMQSTATINIDTSDMINWRPTNWQCTDMPSTATINIDTSDMINWRPTTWRYFNMPSTATINIAVNSQLNWITTSQLLAFGIHISTVQCDAIIEEFWQQALAGTRTATGGTINISANSPITGAVEPPPGGTPTTTGQKVYELVNDSGARGFNTWTTVTVDTA